MADGYTAAAPSYHRDGPSQWMKDVTDSGIIVEVRVAQ